MSGEAAVTIDDMMRHAGMTEATEGYGLARRGMQSLVQHLADQVEEAGRVPKIDRNLIDLLIAELDEKLSRQLDEILHDPEFQRLESRWRGLDYLVKRADYRENIRVEVFSATKDELLEDFEDAGSVIESGLYSHVYTKNYGQYGGEPYGVIVGDYEFSPGGADIDLLRCMADLAAMSHAPFLSAANEQFFGVSRFEQLPSIKDLDAHFEGPRYAAWRDFRESDTARYVGLALPRFLLRAPYGPDNPVREGLPYKETAGGDAEKYIWGNPALALATRLQDSFARYRWCPNIIGPLSGGRVGDLPVDRIERDGQEGLYGPTQVPVSDRREYELSDHGFIPMVLRKGTTNAAFFSANSVQKPRFFGVDSESRAAELNYRLGTQLPYLFIVNRMAHYLKVLQRENLGGWKSRTELEQELNTWLRQYVADQDNPSPATRSQRPLRQARISVSEVPGEAGWYQIDLRVTPHFKFMGSNFTLSLTGLLDRV